MLATWPAVRHIDGHYLARPSAGFGEAAAGDHLQLSWAFWLPGHQLSRGAAPWADPYSFQPESHATPNVQGWLLGAPYWPLDRLFGHVWAYDLIVLLTIVLAGAICCAWLRALGLARGAALIGGLAFALAPYRVGQSTGHLLGLIAFLLPATLLALERRRLAWAGLALTAIPLSGQIHLAMGAVLLSLGYAWARLPRADWWRAAAGALAAAFVAVAVQQVIVSDSVVGSGRPFNQVRFYSADLSDFFTRNATDGIEKFVFIGWAAPIVALGGLWVVRRRRGLAALLGISALLPCVLALGSNVPVYEPLWRTFKPLQFARVPERLMPIACLALAALAAVAIDAILRRPRLPALGGAAVVAVAAVVLAVDLHVPVFGAVAPDGANAAYAAIEGPGRLLELPVFRPGIHFGSVYEAYARQSPRQRPQGYSTTARLSSYLLARNLRSVSCGRGVIPDTLGVRFVAVHRGLYAQSRWFGKGCADAAEAALQRRGWRLLARDGAISTWAAPA